MARWRSNNKRHRKRHAFSKRKERAIKAIAMGPVETKRYYLAPTPFSSSSTTTQDYGRYYNIFANLRKDQAGPDSEENVIGNKFNCRGVKIWIQSNSSVDYEVVYRATVISCNDYFYTSPTIGAVLEASNVLFYETDLSQVLPRKRYNTQSVTVLKSKVWSNQKQYSTMGGVESFIEMWVPITGTKTSKAEEETDSTVNELKGKQYYLLIEQYMAGARFPFYINT